MSDLRINSLMQKPTTDADLAAALKPSWYLDSDNPQVIEFAKRAIGDAQTPVEKARRLFYAVRDGFRYDPYTVSTEPTDFRASTIVTTQSAWCVPKSVMLTAAARAVGIPARLGFADVKNHLTSKKLSDSMGTDLFAWHGYSELWLNEKWVAFSTAFNIELCDRFGTKPLEFDAENGALMHAYDQAGNRHMEYVNQRGSFNDLPLNEIFETFLDVYPDWVKDENGDISRKKPAGDAHDEAFHR